MTTVLIVDDHPVVRDGVAVVLAFEPSVTSVHQAGTADEALRVAAEMRPELALIDVRLKGESRVELCTELLERRLVDAVIAFSVHGSEGVVTSVFSAGARGFVLKSSGGEVLRDAVRAVARGERFVDPSLQFDPFREKPRDRPFGLTNQQLAVTRAARRGLTAAEIGRELGIAEGTVRIYLKQALWKTGARDRAELLSMPLDDE